MRRKSLCILFALIQYVFFVNSFAFASNVVLGNDLVERAKELDKRKVIFTGEAIGDIMYRGSYAWLNVADASYPIGIWMKSSDARKVKFRGDYFHIGDTIEVKGSFNRACPEHGGDFDIHADSIKIIKLGNKINRPLDPAKIKFALLTSISALAIYAVSKWRSVRDRVKIRK